MDIVAIRHRPASWDFSSSSVSAAEVAAKRRALAWPAPSVLVSRMPLTDRPSSTWVCMSARWRCWRAVISRRRIATLRESQTEGGMTSRESSESRQLNATMAAAVAMAVVTLLAMEVAVLVTTPCIPAMSLVKREVTSPPRVRVKKPSDWRCR